MPKHTGKSPATFASYAIGFGLSLLLTAAAFLLVSIETGRDDFKKGSAALVFGLMGLATVQLYVQVYYFLHLGQEKKPRWNLLTFLFMLMVVIIVVFGSLWIMSNLDYHGGKEMSPDNIEQYIQDEEIIYKDQ